MNGGPANPLRPTALLDVRDLKVGLPTRRGPLAILNGVDLHVKEGEVLGVVGESGAGKSITGLAVIGLLEPPARIDGGEVWFDGARIDGLSGDELRRIRGARIGVSRLVILTWDPEPGAGFWLLDYFPGILEMDRGRFPPLDQLVAATGGRSYALPVPHDCSDGFLGAWWREPAAYLDARLRAAMSGFVLLPDHEEEDGLARLDADIRSGAWERRHGALREHEALDLGYRLVVAEVAQSPA